LFLYFFYCISTDRVTTSIIKFTLVAIACAFGLLLQCVLLLYSSFTTNSNSVFIIVILMFVELTPAAILLITLRQPHNLDNTLAYRNIFWCFSGQRQMDTRTQTTSDVSPKFTSTEILHSATKNDSL